MDNRGGRRSGSGRPKGSTQTAIIAAKSQSTDLATLKDIPLNHLSVCILQALGMTNVDISKLPNMPSQNTITAWSKHPAWDAQLAYYRELFASDPLRAAKPLAHSTIIKKAAEGSLDAANSILDRVDGKPIVREQRQSIEDIHIIIEDVTPK